jgi:hypothetical protein
VTLSVFEEKGVKALRLTERLQYMHAVAYQRSAQGHPRGAMRTTARVQDMPTNHD